MHDLFAALLNQPTARRYKQLRSLLLSHEPLGSFSLRLAEVQRRVEEGDAEAAGALAKEMFPAGLLSLRLHRLAGQAALDGADLKRAELHRFTYEALCSAILATGNGTRGRPLLITYASDAAELLAARGLEVQSQSLIEEQGRRYDVHLCREEREFWFDVTDLLPAVALSARTRRRPQLAAAARSTRRKAVSRR